MLANWLEPLSTAWSQMKPLPFLDIWVKMLLILDFIIVEIWNGNAYVRKKTVLKLHAAHSRKMSSWLKHCNRMEKISDWMDFWMDLWLDFWIYCRLFGQSQTNVSDSRFGPQSFRFRIYSFWGSSDFNCVFWETCIARMMHLKPRSRRAGTCVFPETLLLLILSGAYLQLTFYQGSGGLPRLQWWQSGRREHGQQLEYGSSWAGSGFGWWKLLPHAQPNYFPLVVFLTVGSCGVEKTPCAAY